jgi:hypothetical protein
MRSTTTLVAGGAAVLLLLLLADGRRDASTSLMQKTGSMPRLSMLDEVNMVSFPSPPVCRSSNPGRQISGRVQGSSTPHWHTR